MPSATSNSTTSPSSWWPTRWASVPPIWPAPIKAILERAIGRKTSDENSREAGCVNALMMRHRPFPACRSSHHRRGGCHHAIPHPAERHLISSTRGSVRPQDMYGRRTLAMLAIACCATVASAQTYPSKPIKVIVPYTPGSPVDVLARVVTQQVSARLGQSIVIDNRPGAGTTIGTKLAGRRPRRLHAVDRRYQFRAVILALSE